MKRAAIKIDKGIPLPSRGKTDCIYPWREMKVGDSFLAPPHAAHGAYKAGQRYGMTFAVRTEGKGKRVWRTK